MPSNKNKNTEMSPRLQKVLAISGLLVIALAIVASIDIFITDRIYMHTVLDIGYHGRYIVTIVGGFGIGLLLANFSHWKLRNKPAQKSMNLILTAVTFSLLTYASWLLLDYIRLPMREMFGDLPFPWSRIVFYGLPFAALIFVSIIAFIAFLRGVAISASHNWLRWLLAGVFGLLQLANFISLVLISSDADYSEATLAIAVIGLVTTPLAVSVLAYFLVRGVASKVICIFSATLIGLLYQIVRDVSWEFRTDPDYEATLAFNTIVTCIAFALSVALIFMVRYAAHQKK